MIGQGSPTARTLHGVRGIRKIITTLSALFALALLCAAPDGGAAAHAQEQATAQTFLLRFEWGGPRRVQWSGSISVDRGRFHDPAPLGMEADAPGSVTVENGQLVVAPRSGRRYDGVDVSVTAEPDAEITVRLVPVSTPDSAAAAPPNTNESPHTNKPVVIPLSQLLNQSHSDALDENGSQLVARRAPGDRLRVSFQREHLIFDPGEHFVFRVTPRALGVSAGTEIRLRATLSPARSDESLWSEEYPVKIPPDSSATAALALDVPLPENEGVYDIVLSAERQNSWLSDPFQKKKLQLSRTVQVVVLDRDTPPAPQLSGDPWRQVLEIDPTHPSWWQRLPGWSRLEKLPGMPRGPLGSGHAETWRHPLAKLIRLAPREGSSEPSWQAYPLPIKNPGVPHMLEIEYPSDVSQHLGVSILEPNAAGLVWPIELDSGVYQEADETSGPPRMLRHRLIFWPKTETPLVLLTNRLADQPAAYGRIRVSRGPSRLPRALPVDRVADQRQIAAQMARPLFNEQFGATEAFDLESRQSVDDWRTFHEGTTRLIDYLNHVGYNGLMVSVMADGSTIYPSRLVGPTPLYDSGQLAATGQDPVRKDALELLLRVADREGLRIVPSLRFDSTLPALEPLRRRAGADESGIEWVGPDGLTWTQRHSPLRKQAPYYNILSEQVQMAMLSVVDELLVRYARHPSLQGIAIPLAGYSFAQIPGAEWGMDDATIARFERETQIRVPGADPNRFAQRAAFLLASQEHRQLWLTWRASVVEQFYQRLAQRIRSVRPDLTLVLTTAEMFDGPSLRHDLQPAFPRRVQRLDELMLDAGIRPQQLESVSNIVLLRPQVKMPPDPLVARARAMELDRLVSIARRSPEAYSAAIQMYHPPLRQRLASFDAVSPFGRQNTFIKLVAQPTPSAEGNRRRFVHELADGDVKTVFDGGYLLPMGQEDALRPLFDLYRRLPATSQEQDTLEREPVTVRTLTGPADTMIYLVNDSPWKLTARLELELPGSCTLTRLGAADRPQLLAPIPGQKTTPWSAEMTPYDLIVLRFSLPGARARDAQVEIPPDVPQRLEARLDDLVAREVSLIDKPALDALTNASFESKTDGDGIEGWELSDNDPASGFDISLDKSKFHATPGRQEKQCSLRLSSRGPVATLRSKPLPVPKSGRLIVSVWLLVSDPKNTSEVRIRVESPDGGQKYFEYAQIGAPGTEAFQPGWKWYVFPVENLYDQNLDQVRVRFDLMGPGVVWIDDVQLRKFQDVERMELSKLFFSARRLLSEGKYGSCLNLLESYWPRYLQQNVPAPEESAPIARSAGAKSRNKPEPREAPGVLDRMKGYVPRFMRF